MAGDIINTRRDHLCMKFDVCEIFLRTGFAVHAGAGPDRSAGVRLKAASITPGSTGDRGKHRKPEVAHGFSDHPDKVARPNDR